MKKLKKLLVLPLVVTVFFSSVLTVSAAEIKDLFDAEYYAGRYEDLSAAFGDDEKALYNHYITYGIKEGRSASARFDVQIYRNSYGDLQRAFGDDWAAYLQHYLTYGIKEGRDGGGEFDASSYANRYPDLYKAFGYNFKKLYRHYQVYGIKEQRNPISEALVEAREAAEAAAKESKSSKSSSSKSKDKSKVETTYYPDGTYSELVFNSAGLLESEKIYAADGTLMFQTKNEFDAAGNIIKGTYSDANGTVMGYGFYTYDSAGNQIKEIEKDASGAILFWVEREYDSAGNCTKRVGYNSEGIAQSITEYVYDASGNQTKEKDWMINPETGEAEGYWLNESSNNGRIVIAYHYDADDVLQSKMEHKYDASGRETERIWYDINTDKVTSKDVYNADGTMIHYSFYESGQISCEYHHDTEYNRVKEIRYNEDGTVSEEIIY